MKLHLKCPRLVKCLVAAKLPASFFVPGSVKDLSLSAGVGGDVTHASAQPCMP